MNRYHLITTVIVLGTLLSCDATEKSSQPSPDKPSGVWGTDSIIDIHGHTGLFRGYDLSTETLLSNIDSFGIRMVFISNVDGANLPGTTRNLDARSANQATLEVVLRRPDRLRGIAWARPPDGQPSDVEPFLRPDVEGSPLQRPFVAIKLHPIMNQFPADVPAVDPYFDLARQYGVPIVYHSDKPGTNADPERIYAAARRHPDVPVILYHSVFFGPHDPAVRVVEQAVQRGDADLYLETAQADPDAILAAVRRLGSTRVLFGTDATYFGTRHYVSYEPLVSLLRRELTPEEFADVMRTNARTLFPIGEDGS